MSKKRVGNTTNSPRNTEKITRYNKRYSEELEEYKRFATARRNRRKYTQEKVIEYYQKLGEYVADRMDNRKPLTIAGTQLALNVSSQDWTKWNNCEYDYLLEEYIDIHSISEKDIQYRDDMPFYISVDAETGETEEVMLIPYSGLTQKVYQMIQVQLEENCYTNKGNPAGSIFSLKAQFQWREEEQPQHLVQQLVIADSEQAKRALEMLRNG